jgi:L-glyceraldehyde 3-phosphate reductase
VGISSYDAEQTRKASKILKELGTPCLIHQPSYSMFNRWIENGLQQVLEEEGMGTIAFSPLAQGLLSDKYLSGIPADSRAAKPTGFLKPQAITEEKLKKVMQLNEMAKTRGQSLSQMAIAWILRKGRVTSALVGASKVSQIEENIAALNNLEFSEEELNRIDEILK